jgi:hypothetical protein
MRKVVGCTSGEDVVSQNEREGERNTYSFDPVFQYGFKKRSGWWPGRDVFTYSIFPVNCLSPYGQPSFISLPPPFLVFILTRYEFEFITGYRGSSMGENPFGRFTLDL